MLKAEKPYAAPRIFPLISTNMHKEYKLDSLNLLLNILFLDEPCIKGVPFFPPLFFIFMVGASKDRLLVF